MFSNGSWNIEVSTVGELIDELSLLDEDMPVEQGRSQSVDIVIHNHTTAEPFVGFDDGGEWGQDEGVVE